MPAPYSALNLNGVMGPIRPFSAKTAVLTDVFRADVVGSSDFSSDVVGSSDFSSDVTARRN